MIFLFQRRFSFASLLLFLSFLSEPFHRTLANDCAEWASMGECDNNPGYMLNNCKKECDEILKNNEELKKKFESVSFYDLSARDIDGTEIKFDSFQNKVVVITNVASYCGYTESHYRGLVELYSDIQSEPVQILAFPCNQFGAQEPGTNAEIKEFAKNKGVEFTLMDKVNVNGPAAHDVFQFLKYKTSTSSITWNFATYFLISPDGTTVTAHVGVEPLDLKEDIFQLLNKDEL